MVHIKRRMLCNNLERFACVTFQSEGRAMKRKQESTNYQEYADVPNEEDGLSNEAVLLPEPWLIPIIVLFISGVLAIIAYKWITPIAAQLYPTQGIKTPLIEAKGELAAQSHEIASFFTPEVKYWQPQIALWAEQYQLDANLIATVMQIESCGDMHALSGAGAMGLFQVMPFHFEAGENAYDPDKNAQRGLAYLRQAYQARQGDVRATLASYNGGITGASQPESYWSAQMLRYVRWGMGIYQEALQGKKHSETLQAWLDAGGASLCEQARSNITSLQIGEEYSFQ